MTPPCANADVTGMLRQFATGGSFLVVINMNFGTQRAYTDEQPACGPQPAKLCALAFARVRVKHSAFVQTALSLECFKLHTWYTFHF